MKRSSTALESSSTTRVEVAARVHEHDRVEVEAEALQRQGLEQLVERAAAAGQRHDPLAALQHQVLALPHVVDQQQLRQPPVTPLELDHEAGQHAHDGPPRARAPSASAPIEPPPPPP